MVFYLHPIGATCFSSESAPETGRAIRLKKHYIGMHKLAWNMQFYPVKKQSRKIYGLLEDNYEQADHRSFFGTGIFQCFHSFRRNS